MSRFRTGSEDKPTWSEVPRGVRLEVERVLGSRVVSARRVWGGYAPSATFRLRLEGGGADFFKGVDTGVSPFMTAAIRREMRTYRDLPAILSWAPALLGAFTMEDWEVLLLEFVPVAAAAPPWKARHAKAAARALAGLHNAFTGGSLPDWLPPTSEVLFGAHHGDTLGWRGIQEGQHARALLTNMAGKSQEDASRWLERYLPALVEMEALALSIAGPTTLLHMDVRSDNLLFRKDGRVAMVDWSHPCQGPGIMDAAAFFISAAAEGGPAPEQMLAWYSEELAQPVSDDDINSAAAAWAGFFASRAGLPDVPGAPRIRPFQRAQLVVSLEWLARRAGWQQLAAGPRVPPSP